MPSPDRDPLNTPRARRMNRLAASQLMQNICAVSGCGFALSDQNNSDLLKCGAWRMTDRTVVQTMNTTGCDQANVEGQWGTVLTNGTFRPKNP